MTFWTDHIVGGPPFKQQLTIVIFIHYSNCWLVVNEDDFNRVANEKNIVVIKQCHENVCSKTPMCRKWSHTLACLEMQDDASMHCEGLTVIYMLPRSYFTTKPRVMVGQSDFYCSYKVQVGMPLYYKACCRVEPEGGKCLLSAQLHCTYRLLAFVWT